MTGFDVAPRPRRGRDSGSFDATRGVVGWVEGAATCAVPPGCCASLGGAFAESGVVSMLAISPGWVDGCVAAISLAVAVRVAVIGVEAPSALTSWPIQVSWSPSMTL